MGVSKDDLLNICELFPQTADNIKRRSLERRFRFMQQKNSNSREYKAKMANKTPALSATSNQDVEKEEEEENNEDQYEDFYSDEEP
jgi:hypothetical protein